jgi:hypothetical protein
MRTARRSIGRPRRMRRDVCQGSWASVAMCWRWRGVLLLLVLLLVLEGQGPKRLWGETRPPGEWIGEGVQARPRAFVV